MATSEQLRSNKLQHQVKNKKSKMDDKDIYICMDQTISYLQKRFSNFLNDESKYYIELQKKISIKEMINVIKQSNIRQEYFNDYDDRTIIPDGGVLILKKRNDSSYFKVLLIAETKRQGTNDERLKEGKSKQSRGNAIERLAKNLIGIRSMMMHEKITPFVCFGWGCDFNHEDTYIDSKIFMMNEFYKLNSIYIFKKDGAVGYNSFAPVSMYFREFKWTINEMFDIMKEIAETSLRYYLF